MDKQDWHMLLHLLLSHHRPEKLNRTIHVSFRGKSVYVCARCTGVYSGVLSVFVAGFFGFGFPLGSYVLLFALLPIPSAIDWITQSSKKRESRNAIRISTGFLFGVSQGLFLLMIVNGLLTLFLQALAIIGVYLSSVYVIAWKTKCLDSYFD